MFPYIAVTGFIAIMALLFPSRRKQPLLWLFAFILLLIFVGLRHHVGMDWNNYLMMIKLPVAHWSRQRNIQNPCMQRCCGLQENWGLECTAAIW